MQKYGQFCPIAKSTEILGNPWSLLIIRELLLGSNRFSLLQKGLPRISPALLTKRLNEMEQWGLLAKRRINGQRGYEYHLTAAGKELSSVIENLAVWGMRWARDEMEDEDVDASFLMFDIQRNIDLTALPDGETVLLFQFSDLSDFSKWWLVCNGQEVDICYQDPGKDVNFYLTANSFDLMQVWMGDISLKNAVESEKLSIHGELVLEKSFTKWFPLSSAAPIERPSRD